MTRKNNPLWGSQCCQQEYFLTEASLQAVKDYKVAIHCWKGWNYLFVQDLNLITLVTLIWWAATLTGWSWKFGIILWLGSSSFGLWFSLQFASPFLSVHIRSLSLSFYDFGHMSRVAYLSTRSWTWNGSKNKDIMWMWKGNLWEGLLPEAIGVVLSLLLYQVILLASIKVPLALRASPPRLQVSNEETMEIVPENVPDPPANVQQIKKWVSGPARRSRIVFDFLSQDECRLFIWMYDNDWGDCGKSVRHARASSMSSIVVSSQTTVNHINNYLWK